MNELELKAAMLEAEQKRDAMKAEMKTAMDSQKAELKAEIEKIEGMRAEMQKQLDQIATDLEKSKKEGAPLTEKSFLEDLSIKLKENINEFVKFKNDPTYRKEITLNVKNFLETANASVTTGALIPWPERELGVAKAPDRMPKLMNLVDVGAVMSSTIYWVERKTRTDQTQWVAEGIPPTDQVVLGYNTVSQAVKNVASFIKVSNDSLDDIDYLIGEIRSELVTLMMLKVDNDILLGTIALNGYDGIDALATAFAVPGGFKLNAGDIANNKDVLRAAITQVQNANFMPDVILINPNSAMEMDLERNAEGDYVIPPFATLDYTRIKGIQVVESAIVPADTFYVGNFKKAKLLVRKDAELKVWDQNDTDPIDQLKTVTMYMRLALRIKTPDRLAFVKGTFTAGKALLNVI